MDATQAAKQILNMFWDGILPVNPTAIVYSIGGKILYSPDISEEYLLHTDETNKPVITINPYKTYLQQRFLIFMALGNFI